MEKDHRLFVRNLHPTTESAELQKLFDSYGTVTKVDIKEKLQADGNKIAFVNITTTERNLTTCCQNVSSAVLCKGNRITVELAKESFTERLKRIRENSVQEPCGDHARQKSREFCNEENEIFEQKPARVKAEQWKQPVNKANISEAELKRLASLKKHKEAFKAKEQCIRNALKAVDIGNTNNKIIFNDDIDKMSSSKNEKETPKGRMLFDDDDEDVEFNGDEVKFNFSETKKPKLKKIANDARFTIDERFLEDQKEEAEKPDVNEGDNEFRDEQRKQLEILENVLGRPIAKKDDQHMPAKRKNKMIRYDPNEDGHRQHEIAQEDKKLVPKKKRKKIEVVVEDESPLPVSNEIFYSVSNTLTDTLKEQEGFSLLKAFGRPTTNDDKNELNMPKAISNKQAPFGFNFDMKNPFKYDSTDEEDENVDNGASATEKSTDKSHGMSTLSQQIDTFFFTSDDPRFKEAVKFFQTNATSNESFTNTRRELKQIVRSKIRNNLRKSKPRKKNLGMKKR